MKKINFILILLLFVTVATAQKKVAVFDPTDNSNTGMAEIIREVLSTGMTNSPDYVPVEREMIEQVLQENNYQATGMVEESKISELGKQMETNYFITSKLVNVTSATVELQQYVKTVNGDNDLFEKVEELSEKLFGKNGSGGNSSGDNPHNLPIIEVNFKKYMIMPKDFDTKYNWEDAKQACEDLTAYGYNDWYWSSSDIGDHSDWSQSFDNGFQDYYDKVTVYRVRAVRAF